jgi:hypothetical protein
MSKRLTRAEIIAEGNAGRHARLVSKHDCEGNCMEMLQGLHKVVDRLLGEREIPCCGVLGPDGRSCFYGTGHGRPTHSWQDAPPNKWDVYERIELDHAHGVCDEKTCLLCEAYRQVLTISQTIGR